MGQKIFDESVFIGLMPELVQALGMTLILAAVSLVFGFVLGSMGGYALQSNMKPLKIAANAYVWLFRCTPLMVQALYVYFVFPKILHINLSSAVSGLIVLSLVSGAYISNIVYAALTQIDVGQKEAGAALGMTGGQVLWHIVAPPAFKTMIPSLFNQFIVCVKDTAVLSVIGVAEMTHITKTYANISYKTLAPYTLLAVFYWVIVSILIAIQKMIEKKVEKNH